MRTLDLGSEILHVLSRLINVNDPKGTRMGLMGMLFMPMLLSDAASWQDRKVTLLAAHLCIHSSQRMGHYQHSQQDYTP
jgi:hypothetical protein